VYDGLTNLCNFQTYGFPGRLYPINPRGGVICGLKAYTNLRELPEVPDLVMVSVPERFVPASSRTASPSGR